MLADEKAAPLPDSASVSRFGKDFPSLRLIPKRRPLVLAGSVPKASDSPPASADLAALPLASSEVLATGHRRSSKEPAAIESSRAAQVLASTGAEIRYAFGGGMDRMPRWIGSRQSEIRFIPYIDINWRDQIQFSTVKGLIVDVIYGERWHGGLIGTMVWGRSVRDLAGLRVPTLQNTLQAGLYLEYAATPQLSIGARLRHDIQNTRVAYAELYAELELPKIGYFEHDIRITQDWMNHAGMRRFFGVAAGDAAQLGVTEYDPKAGAGKTYITYEGFMPTSESTGIAFSANYGRLNTIGANSPLVKNFGSPIQREMVAAFFYHF